MQHDHWNAKFGPIMHKFGKSCYMRIFSARGMLNCCLIYDSGGTGNDDAMTGENGTLTGKDCPPGLFGVFCKVLFAK